MSNNTAFFDAVVAGVGGAHNGWVVDENAADYTLFANAAEAIATVVDLQIPTIPGGPSTAQVNLLSSITQNVFAGRLPVSATLGLYLHLGRSIAAIYNAVAPKLQGTGGSGSVQPIANTLVVDSTNGVLAGPGTFSAPFLTVQAAIDYAELHTYGNVLILIAPGTYNGTVAIPGDLTVTIHGWDQQTVTILGGSITIIGGVASYNLLSFTNCDIQAGSIATVDPATQDLGLSFTNCTNGAAISGFNIYCWYKQSAQNANITAAGNLSTSWDGYSWARTLQFGPVFFPANYTRQFLDAGHDTYGRSITINGLAIGATGFVTAAVPAYIRDADRVQIQVADPSIQDFICGIHGVTAGNIVVWITNLSRVSTNFAEAVALTIHHLDMISEPAP
jgi:hypothetical protein